MIQLEQETAHRSHLEFQREHLYYPWLVRLILRVGNSESTMADTMG